ncbi:MAG: tetratricopeptide repeat protein, partial [Bacteroidota bacterium]
QPLLREALQVVDLAVKAIQEPYDIDLQLLRGDILESLKLEAENIQQMYLDAFQKAQDREDQLRINWCLSALSRLHLNLNEFDTAEQYAKDALHAAEGCEDQQVWINVYVRLGYVYARQHQYYELLDYFEKVLHLSRKEGDIENEIVALINIAISHSSRRDYKQSLKLLLQALDLGEQIDYKLSNVKCLVNISTIFYVLYNPTEALRRYLEILENYFDILDTNTLTVLYYNLGDTYHQTGDLEASREYFSKCLEVGQESSYNAIIAMACVQLSRSYLREDIIDQATSFIDRAEAIYKQLGIPQGYHNLLITKGRLALKHGDPERAAALILEGTKFAEKYEDFQELPPAFLTLSTLYKDLGKFELALMYHELYASHQEKLYEEKRDRQLIEMEIKYETREKEKQIELLEQKRQKQESLFQERISRLKMQALQAQMNPHFIFNAMNAIQQFITMHDGESAMLYLSRFARLIRLIFEFSKKTTVSLQQELDFLENYLELEKLRFVQKFTVELEVDPMLSLETTDVPPLLVQPLIENSLKHGLLHRAEGGRLQIEFFKKEQLLHCCVTDNGIGREASKKLGAWRPEEYRSSGLRITRERLEILMNQYEHLEQDPLSVVDLKNDQGDAVGTRVELFIPLPND